MDSVDIVSDLCITVVSHDTSRKDHIVGEKRESCAVKDSDDIVPPKIPRYTGNQHSRSINLSEDKFLFLSITDYRIKGILYLYIYIFFYR